MNEPHRPTVFVVVPVFNRIERTLSCLEDLRAQHYRRLRIVVVDGGSTDDTVARMLEMHDVTVIAGVGEQWWTGATWLGIEYALAHGEEDDFALLLNNDTAFGPELVEVLVQESQRVGGVVAPVVRALDGSVLNSGTWIDWNAYRITQRTTEPERPSSTWRVDAVEGRGTLVPIRAVRTAGNVERERLPHYAADYEFSLRLARCGFPLHMTNRTTIEVDWDAEAQARYSSPASIRRLWWEFVDQRSSVNLRTHFALIDLASPSGGRRRLKARFVRRRISEAARRSRLRDLPGVKVIAARRRQVG